MIVEIEEEKIPAYDVVQLTKPQIQIQWISGSSYTANGNNVVRKVTGTILVLLQNME